MPLARRAFGDGDSLAHHSLNERGVVIRIALKFRQICFASEQVFSVANKHTVLAAAWYYQSLLSGCHRIVAGNRGAIPVWRDQE